ncbi:unnamed protein product [Spirodela intermedia]|uniref:Kazal-like domain-containing protein n=2 Tax=Spirodela intermedia TaxID=51605 RepID=A0A7I8JVN4_SPIIN|nr:unnamed protein product [Spirodela intermedia]CAA6673703.1 unnamed protein product [Spirodela intermedia]CAA7410943.1 unnamed protein product [Spirodela intermedia]
MRSPLQGGSSAVLLPLLVFLLVGSLLPGGARSEPPPDDGIRLPSDGGAVCPSLPEPAACPVACFRPDPVCGTDGVTYWCGCADAACAGAPVAKLGFCEVGSSGAGVLPGQALLLVHLLWLIALAFSVVLGLF